MNFKNMVSKFLTTRNVMVVLVIALLAYLWFYSSSKTVMKAGFSEEKPGAAAESSEVVANEPVQSAQYQSVDAPAPTQITQSAELLPLDSPVTSELSNINFLSSTQFIGMQSSIPMRNQPVGSQALRGEFEIPRVDTGPWNQSTIEFDHMRKPVVNA